MIRTKSLQILAVAAKLSARLDSTSIGYDSREAFNTATNNYTAGIIARAVLLHNFKYANTQKHTPFFLN